MKLPSVILLALVCVSIVESTAFIQPLRITPTGFELSQRVSSATNPSFVSRAPQAYLALHGATYRVVNPLESIYQAMPVRQGDYLPFDLNYFKLDPAEFTPELAKLKLTNATVVRFFSRGISQNGTTFRFSANDSIETQFMDTALANGIYAIPSYWFSPNYDISNAANITAITTHFRTMVAAHKTHEAVITWGLGQLHDSAYTHYNFTYVKNLMLAMARVAALEDNIPAGLPAASASCNPRRPVLMSMGTDDIFGQLLYSTGAPAVTSLYYNFPGSPGAPLPYTPYNSAVTGDRLPVAAVPASCTWEEWTSRLWISKVLYNKYNDHIDPLHTIGVSTRQRFRLMSWGEPRRTHFCTSTTTAGC